MKIFLISLCGLFFLANCNGQNITNNNKVTIKENGKYFQVLRIDSLEKVYIIYAMQKDSVHKIISAKVSEDRNCNRIELGKYYDLKPTSIFSSDFVQKRFIYGVNFLGSFIPLNERGIIWDLFFSKNLTGLCYSLK